MSVIETYKEEVGISKCLKWSTINPSSYYYIPKEGQAGRKPSTITLKTDGSIAFEQQVIEEIKKILSIEYLCYGYKPITAELFDRGYIINHKKTYRIMKESKLLCGMKISTKGEKRKFVQFRKIQAQYPMQYLCMDIKYIPINNKFAYLLSLIDVYSRKIIAHVFKTSIKQHDVLLMLQKVLPKECKTFITIRNDNGSQFIAKSVRNYLNEINANQEFTHISTPQENAYIESFHSIMERELVSRYEFESFYHAQMKIEQYIFTYNHFRKHGSLNYQTPQARWNEYFNSLPSDKHPIAAKSENLSRFFEEKIDYSSVKNSIFSSKIHLNLDKFGDEANFAFLMANENIFNYICKNYQTL